MTNIPVVEGKKLFPYGYVHVDGCGKVSFYLDHLPTEGSKVKISGCYHLDGSPFPPYLKSIFVCYACGKDIRLTSKNVRDLVHWSETQNVESWQ